MNIGGIAVTSVVDSNGNVSYQGTLPSGKVVPVSQETLDHANDPDWLSTKRDSVLASGTFTDPRDQEAVSKFYDDAPSSIPQLKEDTGGEIIQDQTALDQPQSENTGPVWNDPDMPTSGENQTSDDSGEEQENTQEIVITAKRERKSDYKSMAKPNPLSKFSSYTYGISLYMLTAEAFNNFVNKGGSLSGIKGKGSGVYVVAQSGGINSDVEDRAITISKKAGDGPGYDYFLEDLDLTLLLPGGTNRASPSTEIKFKVVEPQGFNFLRDLSIASDEVNKMSKIAEQVDPSKRPNATSQHFVMGVKFYGYDINGNMVTGDSPEAAGYDNGDKTDQNAVIQRWYPFKISSMKFSLTGKATTYNIEGYPIQEAAAFGSLNTTINEGMKISGATVGEAISDLIKKINAYNDGQKTVGNIGKPNVLNVEYLDENGKVVSKGEIEQGKLVDDETFSAETAPASKVEGQATVADKFNAVTISKNVRAINIAGQTNLIQVMENIIIKSGYIGDALAVTKSSAPGENKVIPKATTKTLTWFIITPKVTVIGRDDQNNTWSYEITYQIKPYKISYLKTTIGSTVSKYPGPNKYYEYWLTGGNSEVLSYSQDYNTLLFVPQLASENKDDSKKPVSGETAVGVKNTVKGSSIADGVNRSTEINNNVAAQLYSPADNAMAKLKIIGDPDYLMSGASNPAIAAKAVYSHDGSIDGRNGQVFIQVTFNTGVDYGENGLFNVDDRIQFYKTDKVKNLGIDGIVFKVNQVHSTFTKGKFEQDLECIIVSESELVGEDQVPVGGERGESSDGSAEGSSKGKKVTTKSQKVRSTAHDKLNANPPTDNTQATNIDVRTGDDYEYWPPSGESDTVLAERFREPEGTNNGVDFGNDINTVDDDIYAGNDYPDGGPEYEA